MGDSQVIIGGESPFDSWPTMSSTHNTPPPGDRRPNQQRNMDFDADQTRIDLPAYSASGEADDTRRDAPPAAAADWPAPQASPYPVAPQPPLMAPAQLTHVPWTAATSWGASSLNTPNTLAGFSYLFWWVSGLLVYFNERHNRFVRFHAVQSILLTGALTVVSVMLYILWQLSGDLSAATHQPAFAHLGQGLALIGYFAVAGIWLGAMFAAWTGHYIRLPLLGGYAERYSAPPRESFPPSPFTND